MNALFEDEVQVPEEAAASSIPDEAAARTICSRDKFVWS
jgi:hypothetical protein